MFESCKALVQIIIIIIFQSRTSGFFWTCILVYLHEKGDLPSSWSPASLMKALPFYSDTHLLKCHVHGSFGKCFPQFYFFPPLNSLWTFNLLKVTISASDISEEVHKIFFSTAFEKYSCCQWYWWYQYESIERKPMPGF